MDSCTGGGLGEGGLEDRVGSTGGGGGERTGTVEATGLGRGEDSCGGDFWEAEGLSSCGGGGDGRGRGGRGDGEEAEEGAGDDGETGGREGGAWASMAS